ncbi:MAG TPA: ABC transporter ATP-binding protein [Thermotogota bacterium]|nr:ABC transporter ATP-binding protein [Thermotogota bacterium]HPJ89086.1 ABC transporter ATP-binding protein [Thermotogota bacterium]HPR96113.1 ABC transporter ATP-binding protein [Thermotogota bacterium]
MTIECKEISKNYGNTKALNKVSITFEDRKIYGLLGRNGAGKTTLLKIISGMIPQYKGKVVFNSLELVRGAMPGDVFFVEDKIRHFNKPASELFEIAERFYPEWDCEFTETAIKAFDLDVTRPVRKLSLGMKTMISTIIALSCGSDAIIFDEPVLTYDPLVRERFYELLLYAYDKKPRTIIISTHLVDEVSKLCERIVILEKGRIRMDLSLEEINTKAYTMLGPAGDIEEAITGLNVINSEVHGNYKLATIFDKKQKDISPNISVEQISLQKLFIHLVGADKHE